MLTNDHVEELCKEKLPLLVRWIDLRTMDNPNREVQEDLLELSRSVLALLNERALLVAVAEAAEAYVTYEEDGPGGSVDAIRSALAAWCAARDGVPVAGGAGEEQSK